MTSRRRTALLAGSAFVLQSLLAALPTPATADDDVAAFAYWRIPLGGPDPDAATPSFGFSMMEAKNVWLTPSVRDTDVTFVPPPLLDLRFSGGDTLKLPSFSVSGVDVGAVVDNALYAGPGEAPHTGEYILIGVGAALGGVIGCAAAGCFDGDDDDNAPVTEPD